MAIIEPGRWDVTITSSGLKQAKTGSDQIVVAFVHDETGAVITAYLSCTDKAWPYTRDKLKACGWDAEACGYRFEDLNSEQSPIVGKRVNILVDAEFDENCKQRNKVAFINAIGGGGVERMEEGEAATFAARLRARLLGGSLVAAQPAPARRNSQPAAAEDDIPPF